MPQFASRLLHARSVAGMTQRELSEKAGISTIQLSRYESGKSTPRPPVLMKLAKALSVAPDWLAGLTDAAADEIHRIQIEIPESEGDLINEQAKALGVPVELYFKYLAFLGASTSEKVNADDQAKAKQLADSIKERMDALKRD